MRLQSSLGRVEQDSRKDLNMGGYIALGRVIKVHHKHNTADVKLIRFNDTLMGSVDNKGRYSCKILLGHALYDKTTGKSSGVLEPIIEGEIVVVAFIDNIKSQPVILGSMHRMDSHENIMTKKYPVEKTNIRETQKFLRVFPSQDFMKVDGLGNIEFATHSKTFMVFSQDNVSDAHISYDFESLTEKDNITGKTRTMENLMYQMPKDFLMVFRDKWEDSNTTWTKFFVNKDGMLRITRDNRDGTLTYMTMTQDNHVKLRRQLDSHDHESGSIQSEVGIDSEGVAYLKSNGPEHKSHITVDTTGLINIKNNKVNITISPDGTTKVETVNCIIESKTPVSLSKHAIVNGDLLVTGNISCVSLGASSVNADVVSGNEINGNFNLYE